MIIEDEFKSEFRASIPMIIKLLDFNMYSVQSLALEAINSFITQGQAIGKVLRETDKRIVAAFLSDIKLAAPIIIYKMASANADVRRSALKTIGSLGAHSECNKGDIQQSSNDNKKESSNQKSSLRSKRLLDYSLILKET